MNFSMPPFIAESIDQFVGRTWILPRIIDWLEQTEERVLLITGQPGAGKSMLIAWLADQGPPPASLEDKFYRDRIVTYTQAVHFCEYNNQSRIPTRFVSNLANQLAQNIPGFIERTVNSETRHVDIKVEQYADNSPGLIGVQLNIGSLGTEYAFSHSVCEPLAQLYKNGYREPILILVDALDEALTYQGDDIDIPVLLSRLSDLPPNFRVLATTRPEPRVLKLYKQFKPFFVLEQEEQHQLQDISTYINNRLAEREGANLGSVVYQIAQVASDNFLVARQVTDDLLNNWGTDELVRITRLSKGLNEIYADFLNRAIGTQEEQIWVHIFKPLLGTLSVVQGEGLTRQQLQSILDLDVDDALRACSQFLSGSEQHGRPRIYHKSFVDFLLDESKEDYRINASKYHKLIANYYTTRFSNTWNQCDEYGLRHLAVHLAESSKTELLIQILLDSPSWMNAKYELFHNDLSLIDDVQIALQSLKVRDETDINHSIKLTFLNVLVGARTFAYNTIALSTLAYLGKHEEALAHVRTRTDITHQIEGLCAIASTLNLKEDKLGAVNLFEEAHKLISRIGDKSKRVKTLCKIASDIALASNERALQIVNEVRTILEPTLASLDSNKPTYELELDDVLSYVLALAGVGLVKELNTLLNKISAIFSHNDEKGGFIIEPLMANLKVALWLVSKDAPQAKAISEDVLFRLQLIERTTIDPKNMTLVLSILARLHFIFGDRIRALQLAEEAYQVASNAQNVTNILGITYERLDVKYAALIEVASVIAYGGDFEYAETIVSEIDSPKYKSEAYCRIATEATKLENQNYALAGIFAEKSIECAMATLDAKDRWELLSEVSWPLVRSGHIDQANRVLGQARHLGLAIFDEKEQVDALIALAISMARCKNFKHSIEIANLTQTMEQEFGCTSLQRSGEIASRADIQKMKIGKRIGGMEGIALLMSIGGLTFDDNTKSLYVDQYEETICIIAKELAKTGHIEKSHQIVKSVLTSIFANEPLLEIVIQYARQGKLDTAIEIATEQIRFTHERAIAYTEIAKASWHSNDSANFYHFLDIAIQGIQHIQSEVYQCQLMLVICASLKDTGHLAEYSSRFAGIVKHIENHRLSFVGENFELEIVKSLINLASDESKHLVEKILSDTLETLDKSNKWAIRVICEVAGVYIKLGAIDQGKQIIAEILYTDIESFNVKHVVSVLAQLGDTKQAVEIIQKHLEFESISTIESLLELAESAATSHLLSKENKITTIHHLLPFLSIYNPSVSLRLLAGFSSLFDAVKDGLSLKIIGEAIQIITWERPSWDKLYGMLTDN